MALAGLHGKDLAHRSIRAENLFFADAEASSIMLGECITTPPAMGQHDYYESLSRSMTGSYGRGEGSPADDLYALGVTIMALVLGRSLAKGLDGEELYLTRVRKGSYATLKGSKDVSNNMELLLRGLMQDNPDERWTLNEVAKWMDGTKPSPIPSESTYALSRPVGFLGTNHTDRRSLAVAFSNDPQKACDILRSQDFGSWISQGFSNEAYTERLERVLGAEKLENYPPGSAGEIRFITRLCAFIDPWGPIHFSGLSMNLDGLSHTVASSFQSGDETTLGVLEDFFSSGIINQIMEIIGDRVICDGDIFVKIKNMAEYAKNMGHGQGFERVLYELNPSLPCQSPKLKGLWVSSAREAVLAVEKLIETTGSANGILDTHFLSYCKAQGGEVGNLFGNIRGGDLPRGSGALPFMEGVGHVQKKYKIPALPHLCRFLCQGLKPIIEGMHKEGRKKELLKKLEMLSGGGDLAKIQSQLNLNQHLEQDHKEFMEAVGRFKQLEAQRKSLQTSISSKTPHAIQQGYNWAAMLGMVASAISAFTSLGGR